MRSTRSALSTLAALACAVFSIHCGGDGDTGAGGGAGSRGDYCAKCASCLTADPNFGEGFCAAFWDGTTFDDAKCQAEGDFATEAQNENLTQEQLDKMSCDEFDSEV